MIKNTSTPNLRITVYCALFTALIIVGGYISIPIPIGPVPIALADFFVMLAGLFLGFKYGLISTTLYLVLGAIGLPVFAGGTAGLAVLFGPTGGFLFGYLFMVAFIGFISDKMKPAIPTYLLSLIVGNILLYSIGVPWLRIVMHFNWAEAFAVGFVPFIAGIVIKIAVAVTLSHKLLPPFKRTHAFSSMQQIDGGDE
ncbi:MAG: biotin transporter BioY [Lachnospiraceae bacterium]|nr:biotin transporter BioY [Lachnospiraceae bacterium]